MKTILLFALIALVYGDEPGAVLRVSKKGVEYGSKLIPDLIREAMKDQRVDDIEGQNNQTRYRFENVHLKDTKADDVKVTLDKEVNGLRIRFENLSSKLTMDYDASLLDMSFMSSRGSAEISLQNTSIELRIRISQSEDQLPKPTLESCKAEIRDSDFTFSSTVISWMYKLMNVLKPSKITQWSQDELCRQLKQYVEKKAYQKIGEVHYHESIDDFLVDYTFLSPVKVTDQSIEGRHKGMVFWAYNPPPTDAQAKSLPSESEDDSDKMFNLWMDEYVAKTFARSAHNSTFLSRKISVDTVSSERQKDALLTTCKSLSSSCAGSHIPELTVNTPNSNIKLDIRSNKVPDVEISEDGVSIRLHGDVSVSTTQSDDELFKLNLDVQFLSRFSVQDNRLVPEIVSYDLEIKELKQGKINPSQMRASNFTHMIVKEIAVPEMSKQLRSGLPLIYLPGLNLKNPEITYRKGSLHLATDVQYGKY